ncbi:predicted protein [Arabidopsis lyrata subsp. lyrata]|uniref:Predicted protein n=1 Tax=Arabidopsis lyrata subsp. lyrata TaxID=81972 RepID=D7KVC6_ARALL|nr:predicted protein [Arabidopsis lyrata subsp. lyrata]
MHSRHQKLVFPLLISHSGPVNGKENISQQVEMGFDPTTSKFVKALNAFYQMSDKTIEEKVNVYKRLIRLYCGILKRKGLLRRLKP